MKSLIHICLDQLNKLTLKPLKLMAAIITYAALMMLLWINI